MQIELGPVVDALPGLVWTAFPDGQIDFLSQRWCGYTGLGLEESRGRGWQAAVHPEDLSGLLAGWRADAAPGEAVETEVRLRGSDGTYRWFLFRSSPAPDASGRVVKWCVLGTDMHDRRRRREALQEDQQRGQALLAGEKRLLEMIASGRPMPEILEALCRLVESTARESYCSIMLLDPSGAKLQEAIAPSIAPEFNESARGWPLDRIGGPCVMAARDKVQVIMSDVASDTRWRNGWRALAQAHGLRSCWSTPIVSQAGKVLGTFALYQREPASPNPLHLELIEQFTHIASIAIERAQHDAALRQSEARLAKAERDLQSMIDTIPVFIAAYEPDGTRSFVNRRWLEYMGLTREEATGPGAKVFPHFHPDDVEMNDRVWRASRETGEPLSIEVRVRRADGEYRRHTSQRVPLRDENGNIVRWYSVGIDIEDRKTAEDALRGSEARLAEAERELQLTLDTLPALVATYRPDGSRVFVNQTWLDYTGLSAGSAIDAQRGSLAPPEDAARIEQEWRKALAAGVPFEREMRLRRADGEYRWHAVRRVPARDETGAVARWYSVGTDIEERKRAEEALRRSEARRAEAERELQLTIDSIPTLVGTYRPDGSRIFVNRTWRDYTGLTLETVRDAERNGFVHPDDAAWVTPEWRKSLATGVPFQGEMRLRRADGEYRWHLVHRVPARDESGAIVKWYSVGADIEEQKRAEEALRASEYSSRLLVDSIPGLVAIFTPDGEFELVNRQIVEYFGRKFDDLKLRRWRSRDGIHPEDYPRVSELFKQSIASGDPFEFELRCQRFDGVYRWFQSRGFPLRDTNGRIVRWYNLLIDIDERKQAEEALRQSEARLSQAERELRLTVDTIPVITWRGAANGYVQQLNKRWFEYTGTTPEQVRGRRWKTSIHPDDLEPHVQTGIDYVTAGTPIDSEARLRRFDGEYRRFLFRPAPLRDEADNIVGWYGAIIDIEDRKRAEEKAAEAERELQRTIDNIPVLVGTYGADGTRLSANKRALEVTGFTAEDLPDERWRNAFHPDEVESIEAQWRACIASGEPFEREVRTHMADGTYRWHWTRRVPLRDETGKIIRWYGVSYDIDDRKRAEEELRLSEAFLAKAQRLSLTGSFSYYSATQEFAWSEELYRIFEFQPGVRVSFELIGSRYHPEDRHVMEEVAEGMRRSAPDFDYEHRLLMPDGSIKWVHVVAHGGPDKDGDGLEYFGAVQDVTHRRHAEEELRRSEAYLAEAQRLSHTGSWVVDYANQKPIYSSEEHHRLFGFDPAAAMPPWRDWMDRIHPEDRPATREIVERSTREKTDLEMDYRICHPDGTVRYVHDVGHPVLNAAGDVVEFVGTSVDVTQRRLAETALDKARSELAHVTRVMSLGALTASIAHEVNQPLAGIITNASTCLRMLAADPPNIDGARVTAQRTIRDGNRAADVITRLRALFSKKTAATETVDLNEATREVLALVFSDLLRNRVVLRTELDDDHPALVTGDRVQLQQVIQNLLRNASEAMSEVNDRPRSLLVRVDEDDDGRVRLSVRDAGVGLGPQEIERLFDTFYTTKSDGMGIGLSVSRSIIENHGGKLSAEANDGPGATFSFSLPGLADAAAGDHIGDAVLTSQMTDRRDVMRNS